ncbi:spermidine synthase [Gilvimarinus algae]|uniref:Methyltransferase domain-containing protein n=1 Tax=Gilvimarinus algae TaxID=3058037 RepID=A0ABT8TJ49_9GAMM|nr:methyltransferase domain-containing protein [Gilvimarinus sp. SDUM040014]MDO3384122.1 methyltransferase domain-containing protein [Gilvimarinus sp. SDUM040014]
MQVYSGFDEFGQRCEVRRAGASVRLYTEGIFHSQYHPLRLLEGNLWDLLWLPVLALPFERVRRVLVLGVGGGAVIRKLHALYPGALIIGVDISRRHLAIARRYFGVRAQNTPLYCADALAFVRHYRGPVFDVIVDDLFSGVAGEPSRVVELNDRWYRQLARLLHTQGLLVANFAEQAEVFSCAPCAGAGRFDFASRWVWQHRLYDNAIGAFYGSTVSDKATRVKRALAARGESWPDSLSLRQL